MLNLLYIFPNFFLHREWEYLEKIEASGCTPVDDAQLTATVVDLAAALTLHNHGHYYSEAEIFDSIVKEWIGS